VTVLTVYSCTATKDVRQWADGEVRPARTYPDIDEARAAAERLAQERADV
jgi:hypothetical protein